MSTPFKHDTAQAEEYAREALARIRAEKLPPTPVCFELWYVYYAASSPEIGRAIDILVANKQKITEERCQELHQRFLSDNRDEETIRRAGDQINATIKNVTGAVHDVKTATTAYSGKLGTVTSQMDKAKNPEELRAILNSVVADTKSMIDQNHKLEEQLDQSSHAMEELQRNLENFRREAMMDGLTGLSNRKSFDSAIAQVAAEAREQSATFCILMIDIDHFKTFNDNYGHQIGDQVLRLVSRTLTDGIKGRDIAARYGGEEFAVILPNTNLQAGILVANALRKAVATKDVINRTTGERLARITMSVGVAEFMASEEIPDLIERADSALYTAKHNGRNQVAAAPTPAKYKKEVG